MVTNHSNHLLYTLIMVKFDNSTKYLDSRYSLSFTVAYENPLHV